MNVSSNFVSKLGTCVDTFVPRITTEKNPEETAVSGSALEFSISGHPKRVLTGNINTVGDFLGHLPPLADINNTTYWQSWLQSGKYYEVIFMPKFC